MIFVRWFLITPIIVPLAVIALIGDAANAIGETLTGWANVGFGGRSIADLRQAGK